MRLFEDMGDWREYRRKRRQIQRELRAERKARGVKRGDPIYDAANTAAAKTESTGGFFTSEPSNRR